MSLGFFLASHKKLNSSGVPDYSQAALQRSQVWEKFQQELPKCNDQAS